ncbi:MAG: FliM/FliN family flagellar motor switch protein, partial [Phycisphaerales bacterium]
PYNVIEPVMDDLASQSWFSVSRQAGKGSLEREIVRSLSRAPLTVTGVLAETSITLRDLMEMSVGDMIVTDAPAAGNVTLCVEGEKKYEAAIGQHKRMRALKVIRPASRST